MICPFYSTPTLMFFAEGVPTLIYYSHFSSIIITLIVGIFVFLNNKNSLVNRLLFLISLLFAAWTLMSLITWTNNSSNIVAFAWSLGGILYASLCISTLYFYLTLVNNNLDVSKSHKISWLFLLLPLVLLTPSVLNIQKFDLINCGAIGNSLFEYYYYSLGLLCFFWVLYAGIKHLRNSEAVKRRFNLTALIGVELFLFAFFFNGFIATYLYNHGLTEDYTIDQFGLFGMTGFMVVLTYMIVKFKAFEIKLAGAQALVAGLIILIGSQLFFVETITNRILVSVTLVLAIIGGFLLVRSVMREIKQREELEVLTKKLAAANERLKELDKLKSEFVSIASHQLRSPLTSIRGYASMLVEESFGKLPEKALEPLKRIDDSARLMAMSIEDYLNVSRIEAGNMKYNMSEFNLRDEVEKVSDDVRPVAMEKGLVLLFRTDLNSKGIVKADIGKTVQIVHNLINNSMKYTPKGSITVLVHDNIPKKRIYVDIIDTGIGINKENLAKLFQKFSRADNANTVNVAGTGLGLFVALRMAEAMGGSITAHSDGDGKGSKFTLELPLAL